MENTRGKIPGLDEGHPEFLFCRYYLVAARQECIFCFADEDLDK